MMVLGGTGSEGWLEEDMVVSIVGGVSDNRAKVLRRTETEGCV